MRSRIVLFFVAFVAWCALTWVPDYQHLIIGFFVAVLVAITTGDLFIRRPELLKHPLRYSFGM